MSHSWDVPVNNRIAQWLFFFFKCIFSEKCSLKEACISAEKIPFSVIVTVNFYWRLLRKKGAMFDVDTLSVPEGTWQVGFSAAAVSVCYSKSVYDNYICVPEVRKFSVCIMQLLHPSLSTPVGWAPGIGRVGRACHVFQFMFGWDELLSDVFLETDVSNGHLTVSEWHRVLVSVEMTSNMMKPTVQGK